MLLREKIRQLQNLTKQKITHAQIAKVLKLGSKQAVQNRITRKQELKEWEIIALDEVFLKDVEPDTKESIKGDYYPDVFGSCGDGVFALSETRQKIEIPKMCFFEPISTAKKYSVINAKGNSMEPFIMDKDRLIVMHMEAGEQIADGKVYVFCYNNEIFIKRLSKNVNRLVIESDNKFYDVIKLYKEEMNNVIIIGQIVGLMRDIR